MATDPTGYISIPLELTRGVSWKRPVRAATTANVTIATALNAGDTIDGVTLAAGDRVLVKDQSTGSQNGIYLAGVTPIRDFDMDQDLTTAIPAEEIAGAFVYVIAGTANAGKVFHTTNVGGGTLGSTTITWTELTASGSPTGAAGGDLSGTYPNPSVVDDSHSHTAATLPAPTGVGPILIQDTPAGSPLVFDDLLQNDDGDDLLYADI